GPADRSLREHRELLPTGRGVEWHVGNADRPRHQPARGRGGIRRDHVRVSPASPGVRVWLDDRASREPRVGRDGCGGDRHGARGLGAAWYVRTWWLTGSPFFPSVLDLWPGSAPGWDVERSMMYRAFNGIYGGDKDVLGYLVLPFRLALMGQREVAAFYESAVGVTFLVAVPVIAWAAWRRRLDGQAFITAAIAVALFVWWTTTGQVARYVMPVVPLLAVVGAHAASALAGETNMGRWVRATLLVPAVA